MAFPGMGFLSLLGGGGVGGLAKNPGVALGGFGQMLGDFLKSPQQGSAPSAAPASTPASVSASNPGAGFIPGGRTMGASPAAFAKAMAQLSQGIAQNPQYADFLRQFQSAARPPGEISFNLNNLPTPE